MPELTNALLCEEARRFSIDESRYPEPTLYGVTDGKAIGTYLEQKFRAYLLHMGYTFQEGNSANGIDFPGLGVDMKVTSIRQPQSSCPFRSARQKIYGLGYSLIVFVYDKVDDDGTRTGMLRITDTIFVEAERTGDFRMTKQLLEVLDGDGNEDDIRALLSDRNLPMDEIGLEKLTIDIMERRPVQGYLTISNALQWRLQYRRVIEEAGTVSGVTAIHRSIRP